MLFGLFGFGLDLLGFGHRFFCPPLPGTRLEIALGSICMFQLAYEGTHGKKMRPTGLKLGIV
jgi:hypothetical protein